MEMSLTRWAGLCAKFLCAIGFSLSGPAHAAAITTGTPTTNVPGSLIDPLGSLTSPLPANWYLLPIEIADAAGLQDWTFDLIFDPGVVTPTDGGGLYYMVYGAEFNSIDPTASNIVVSGVLLGGVLEGVAGFSSGVSGDGLLAYVLFELTAGEDIANGGFRIDNAVIQQQVPEPGILSLMVAALLALSWLQLRQRFSRRTANL